MLNVAKLGAGQERYYLDSVASGVEDYYLGHSEEPGQWTGRGSEPLDLDGVVAPEVLHRVLEGRDPDSGVRFTQARKDRVPGFDLTFSAPKSVSVLWAVTDPVVAGKVRAVHDRALDAGTGVDGTAGVPVAARRWRHRASRGRRVRRRGFRRTSRTGDPQLRTHVLVANMTRCDDRLWRTLDIRAVHWQARRAATSTRRYKR